MKTLTFNEIVKEYNEVLKESRNMDFFVRDKILQKNEIQKLKKEKNKIKQYKLQSIKNLDEEASNVFFHFQCVLNAQISILNIWISLKDNKPYDAWKYLIDAQEYIHYALRIDCNHSGLTERPQWRICALAPRRGSEPATRLRFRWASRSCQVAQTPTGRWVSVEFLWCTRNEYTRRTSGRCSHYPAGRASCIGR